MTAVLPQAITRTPEGGYRVANSRVSLDSVVIGHQRGQSAEEIVSDFPTLTLDEVKAALDFYASNREEVDRYLAEQQQRWRELKARSGSENAELIARLRAHRERRFK